MKKKSEKRQIFTKPSYYLIASIIFGCIAVGFGIMAFKIDILGFIFALFLLATLVCGLITFILLIKKSRNNFQLLDIVQLLILIGFALFLNSLLLSLHHNFMSCRGHEGKKLADLKLIRRDIIEYTKINGSLPDANSWCDSLLSQMENPYLRQELLSHFAFNKNLSATPVDRLNGNILLIIEAEGSYNNFGGAELLTQPLPRYKYYLFPWQKFKYIMFTDGTIVKYRQRDGAISRFEGNPDNFDPLCYYDDIDSFGPFVTNGSNSYSTLRWQ